MEIKEVEKYLENPVVFSEEEQSYIEQAIACAKWFVGREPAELPRKLVAMRMRRIQNKDGNVND